jgi:hypothetical protein
MSEALQFVFEPEVSLADAEMTLHLAMFAIEGLAGRSQVRLDANYRVDADKHTIAVDGSNRVGQMIVRVFAGFLLREFGESAFQVQRVDAIPQSHRERTVTV